MYTLFTGKDARIIPTHILRDPLKMYLLFCYTTGLREYARYFEVFLLVGIPRIP